MLEHWTLIESDLQDAGIDVYSGLLAARPATWLRHQLAGLLAADTRLYRAMHPSKGDTQ